MKMKKTTLKLKPGFYDREEVILQSGFSDGILGIYNTPRMGWRITHIKTGENVVGKCYASKKEALSFVEKFYTILSKEMWQKQNPFENLSIEQIEQLKAMRL